MTKQKGERHKGRTEDKNGIIPSFGKRPIKEVRCMARLIFRVGRSMVRRELVLVCIPDRWTAALLVRALFLLVISEAVFLTGCVRSVRVRSTRDGLLFVVCERVEAELLACSRTVGIESPDSFG